MYRVLIHAGRCARDFYFQVTLTRALRARRARPPEVPEKNLAALQPLTMRAWPVARSIFDAPLGERTTSWIMQPRVQRVRKHLVR